MRVVVFFTLVLQYYSFSAFAQSNSIFGGGGSSGSDVFIYKQIGANAIYNGGTADGFEGKLYRQPSTNSIFDGGDADGSVVAFTALPSGNAIYSGGGADGFVEAPYVQPSGNAIYNGGDADGFVVRFYTQPVGNAIYNGGTADGFEDKLYRQPSQNHIFAGGDADGADVLIYRQSVGSDIFAGGSGDGFDALEFSLKINEVNLTVMLMGPFDGPDMSADLSLSPLFPLQEPFTDLGYTLQNSATVTTVDIVAQNEIVDWIMLELRDTPTTVFASRAALLRRDGSLVDANGINFVRFTDIPLGDYFVGIIHRNHLGVVSQSTVQIGN